MALVIPVFAYCLRHLNQPAKGSPCYAIVHIVGVLLIAFGLLFTDTKPADAQEGPVLWTEPRNIPYLDPGTDTPFLLADNSGGIHAFTSQKIDGTFERVIVYNHWTLESGWTEALDVVLSPLFAEAHAPAAYIDKHGYIHLVFYGGHDINGNIYYTKVHAIEAADASAWSPPEVIASVARPPITVWIEGDADDNLYVLFGGSPEGTGIYATETVDGGETWTLPDLVAATYSERLWPYGLRMHYGESGRLYAVWNFVNQRAWGISLFVATYDFPTRRWNDPVEIAQGVEGGILGVQSASLLEYRGDLFVMYDNGIPDQGVSRLFRRSNDGGRTWSEPVRPFSEMVGGNGPAAFVVDSNNELRVFFGQRTVGAVANQTHGMWYSQWHDMTKSWGGVKSIVSGPLVQDIDGIKGFDPSVARAVVSQGNLLMVVWRTDPGNGNNGVWYSYTELEAPYRPLIKVPTPLPITESSPITFNAALAELDNLSSPQLVESNTMITQPPQRVRHLSNPAIPLIIGLIPVGLFLSVVMYQRNRRRY